MGYTEKLSNGRWKGTYRTPDGRERSRSFARKIDADMQDRHVVNGQEILVRQIDRLPADLHGKLRCADHSRADAIARITQRQTAAPT